MTAPQAATRRTGQRRRVAALAALTTGAAGLILPLGGAAQAATGSKSYNCGKAYGAISRQDWSAKFDVAQPASVYVNQNIALALTGSSVDVPSNEGALWPGTYGGPITVPMAIGGSSVSFSGNASGSFKAGGSTIPFNGTASWTAPALAGDVPVTLKNFTWQTDRNGYTFQCTGTSSGAPYPVTTLVVKSRSHVETSLPATLELYRGDTHSASATVTVDGGTVAGQVRVTVGEGAEAQSVLRPVTDGTAQVPVPSNLPPGEYPVKTEFVPSDNVHYDASSVTTSLVIKEAEATNTTVVLPQLVFADDATTPLEVTVAAPANNQAGVPAGTVELDLDGTKTAATLDAHGKATFQVPAQTVGNHTAQVAFTPANANRFTASTSGPVTLSVKPPAARTTTTATLEHAEIQTTTKGLVDIQVSAAGSMPLGEATLKVNGEVITKPLVNAQVAIELPSLPPGDYPIEVAYTSGNPLSFRNSQADPLTLKVLPPAAQTTTTVSLAKGQVKPDETNTATVTVQGGVGTPQGIVNLQVDGTEYKKALDADGKVTIEIPNQLAPGYYPVRASFEPTDGNRFRPSTSNANGFTVYVEIPTSTTVAVDRQQVTEGDDITATATVNAPSGTPAGTVQFLVDGADHGQATALPGSGTVTTKLNNLPAGQHTVSAVYTPAVGTDHQASTANPVGVDVALAPNTAALTLATPAPVKQGQKATVQATVTYLRGTPAGTVTFSAGGVSRSATVGANGVATAEIGGLSIGTWDVVATFKSNDGAITATAVPAVLKVDGVLTPVVRATATTTTVRLSPASAAHGQKVTATATVSNGAVGLVSFNVGGVVVQTAVVNGQAKVVLPNRGVGRHALTATFVPTQVARFRSSKGTATLTVAKVSTRSAVSGRALGSGKVLLQASVTPAFAQRMAGNVVVTLKPSASVKKRFKSKAKTRKVTVKVAANGRVSKRIKLLKGVWTAKVTYSGSSTANKSTGTRKVRVK